MLAKHWPDVPIAEDVKELAKDAGRLVPDCDILTAGYPCQPFSQAGVRRGEKDDRHIWPEIFTIVQAKRPAWCDFENVSGHISLGLDQVLSDLESKDYAVQPFVVPACAVDAPHRRDRVWIVANSSCRRYGYEEKQICTRRDTVVSGSAATANVGHAQDDRRDRRATQARREGVPDQSDKSRPGVRGEFSRSSSGRGSHRWLPEPPVGRVANGIPRRVDRLKGLGNAIVPQIAMQIGLTIKAVEHG